MMLNRLRWQLTALYLLAALSLIVLMGGGAYSVLSLYFQHTVDLALQNRLAQEFRLQGWALPADLAAAEREWYAERPTPEEHFSDDHEGDDEHAAPVQTSADLAAVFLFFLNANGQAAAPTNAPIAPNAEALAAALAHGTDWRTLLTADGVRVRLFTYRLSPQLAFQAGRLLADQDRVLAQLLLGVVMLGGVSAVAVGLGSWWLAGRTLQPTAVAWHKQQTFVANASHELRTPLTLIRASAEYATRTAGLPADHRALLTDILQETDHMSQLVADLLLLSRLDAGQLQLRLSPFKLREVLEELQPALARVAAEKGVTLRVPATELVVVGDPTRVRQVLLILLDNALRHTPTGGAMDVQVRLHQHEVQVRVTDTGPGIAPEHLPRLFERFYRVDSARGNPASASGAGLGLSIAQALITAQHGHIGAESQVGQGATVWFTLPVAK